MADVQLVVQTTPAGVERLAVLKRARPELARLAEYSAMFWEEARIAATLSHQNVVQTYEVGQDDDGYFMILEFLRGQSYAQVMTRTGYTNYRFSLAVLLGTLQGLEHAHGLKHMSGGEMSLVHRDISPPNVFVTYDGQIKVLDFGIAKARGSLIQTEAGVVKGKVAYMAPEQMLGAPCDLRADLYAVGVMLWEATAGEKRFANVPDIAISSSVTEQRAPLTPGAAERGLPALADEICRRALAHDPAQRYQSASAFHDELAMLADIVGERLSARAVGQYVSDRFVTERNQQQALIEAELDPRKPRPKSEPPPPSSNGDFPAKAGSGTRPMAVCGRRIHARPVTPAPGAESASAPPVQASSPWKARLLLVGGLGALAMLGVNAGAYLSRAKQNHPPQVGPVVATTTPAAPVVAGVPSVTMGQPVSSVSRPESSAQATALAPVPSKNVPKVPKQVPKAAPLNSKTASEFGGRR